MIKLLNILGVFFMNLEELVKIFNFLKINLPEETESLFASFDFFVKNFNEITNCVNKKLQIKISNRDFDDNYIKYTKLMDNTYKILIEILSSFDTTTLKKINSKTSIHSDNPKSNSINYDAYKTDKLKPHSLNELFTNKRPYGYKFLDSEFIEANTWQKIYIGICEKLIYLENTKFYNLKNIIKGKKPYISENKNLLRKPYSLSNGLYIETNQ